MKPEMILLIIAGLYLYSKSKAVPVPLPPVVSTSSAAIPPNVNAPTDLSVLAGQAFQQIGNTPVAGTGFQTCVAGDGNTFQWPASQNCPSDVSTVVIGGVLYQGTDSGLVPLVY